MVDPGTPALNGKAIRNSHRLLDKDKTGPSIDLYLFTAADHRYRCSSASISARCRTRSMTPDQNPKTSDPRTDTRSPNSGPGFGHLMPNLLSAGLRCGDLLLGDVDPDYPGGSQWHPHRSSSTRSGETRPR